MRTFLETIAVGLSLFSAIPTPRFEWNEKNMRYLLLVFPLVGVIIGVTCLVWDMICDYFGLPALVRGAGFTLIPVWLSGGFHLDGYVDTCDALASHGDHAKKAQILRDPHIGAFAAIRIGAYFVLMLAVWSALPESDDISMISMILIFAISRILSGLAVVTFERTPERDLLHVFYDYADEKKVRVILIIADVIVTVIFSLTGWAGICMAICAHLVFFYYHRMSMREFGGVSGDQAGWFLVQAEKWMAIVMVASYYVLPKVIGVV